MDSKQYYFQDNCYLHLDLNLNFKRYKISYVRMYILKYQLNQKTTI